MILIMIINKYNIKQRLRLAKKNPRLDYVSKLSSRKLPADCPGKKIITETFAQSISKIYFFKPLAQRSARIDHSPARVKSYY